MSDHLIKNRPKVSVLMAVFNCQSYLAEAIESIRNQSLTDLELIIIDDGSTDDSWRIISDYLALDTRIKAIKNDENAGKVVALNRGLMASRGDYIAWLDGDDFSAPDRLAQQVAFIEKHPGIGAVTTAALMVDETGNPIRVVNSELHDNDEIKEALLDKMCVTGPSVLVKRQQLEAAGFLFDEVFKISMDYDLCLRLSEVTQIVNLQEPLYYYRQHPNSLSHRKRFRQMFNKALALERAILRRYGPQPSTEQFGHLGRDYLRAAVIGFVSGEREGAIDAMKRAKRFNPSIFDNSEPVETIVAKYVREYAPNNARTTIESLFEELLPRNRSMVRVRSRMLGQLHIIEVFEGAALNDRDRVAKNLLAGIRQDPSWLLNRGIASIALKHVMGRNLN